MRMFSLELRRSVIFSAWKVWMMLIDSCSSAVMQRRRSMEPKALAALNSSLGPGGNSGSDPKCESDPSFDLCTMVLTYE